MTRHTITITATLTDTGWWAIEVPEVPGCFTQARKVDEIHDMAQEAAALLLGVEPEDVHVTAMSHIYIPEEAGR